MRIVSSDNSLGYQAKDWGIFICWSALGFKCWVLVISSKIAKILLL